MSFNQTPLSVLYERTMFPNFIDPPPSLAALAKELASAPIVPKSLWCVNCGGSAYPSVFCTNGTCRVAVCHFCMAHLFAKVPEAGKMYLMHHHDHVNHIRNPERSIWAPRATLLIVFCLMKDVSNDRTVCDRFERAFCLLLLTVA
jgi:hypothetical protein